MNSKLPRAQRLRVTLLKIILGYSLMVVTLNVFAEESQTAANNIQYPADLLGGLERWHLTLPTSNSHTQYPADQIEPDKLKTFTHKLFMLNEAKTAVVFTSIFGGATTSKGTAFARTELRERDKSGKLAAWRCQQATRSLTIRQRIVRTPTAKPEMSVGQIHDAKSDNLEVFYNGPKKANGLSDTGKMLAKFNSEGAAGEESLDDDYKLGDTMVVNIQTDKGVMTVNYKNERSNKEVSVSRPFTQVEGACYFKAGNYHQACTKTNIYGGVNENCASKNYSEERWETDPLGYSMLEMYSLKIDY